MFFSRVPKQPWFFCLKVLQLKSFYGGVLFSPFYENFENLKFWNIWNFENLDFFYFFWKFGFFVYFVGRQPNEGTMYLQIFGKGQTYCICLGSGKIGVRILCLCFLHVIHISAVVSSTDSIRPELTWQILTLSICFMILLLFLRSSIRKQLERSKS